MMLTQRLPQTKVYPKPQSKMEREHQKIVAILAEMDEVDRLISRGLIAAARRTHLSKTGT